MDFQILFCFSLLFPFSSLMLIKEIKPGSDENKFRNFIRLFHAVDPPRCFISNATYYRYPSRIGSKLLEEDVVIRTFPSEASLYHENTELTKKMSMELESCYGLSKSSFDKTDVVMLTLIEKDIDNVTSNIIKSIRVDPLSVDFYPHKLPMEQVKEYVEFFRYSPDKPFCKSVCNDLNRGIEVDVISYREFTQRCPKISCPAFLEETDYPKLMAEMEKFIRTMKYLLLLVIPLPTEFWIAGQWTVLEIDNKTASLFPKLTENHYFIVTFIDNKKKQTKARKIDECRIIQN
ncbi:uncharacterized protein LOC107370799 [Tetranychus urticae]|uniref:Uncharacterized protein n=1 Tax=Tetranychus urticae TaxID=32264 RepID=T1JWB6_TETUR|nr:uncharacterized protein LOC107370799 [Tetranychus urticae]